MTNHHIWFRKVLLGLGLVLGLFSTRVVDLLPAFRVIQFAFEGDYRQEMKVHLLSLLAVLGFSLLAMFVSWGLKYGWTWAFWGGRFCAVVLTCGVPWLTPFGIYGLYALRHRPDIAPALHKRGHPVLIAILRLTGGAAVLHGWGAMLDRAAAWGLPPGWLGYWVMGVLVAGELVVTTVHELGHALMTKIVGFRLQAICIGPLTVWRDNLRKRHYRWTWGNLLGSGGYVGGVPVSEHHVRSNMILVVLAGPGASILASLTLFSTTLALAGTALAPCWELSGALSLLFAVDGVWNLIPVGLNDGGMLLSLFLWSEKGRQLVSDLMSGKLHEDSHSLRMQGDTEAEIRMLQSALAREQESGTATPETLFRRRLELAFAQLREGNRADAEQHLLESLTLLGQMKQPNPSYAANIWMGLRGVYEGTERPAEAVRAYESSITAFEDVLRRNPRPQEIGAVRAAMAGMHAQQDQFQLALDEIARALPFVPSDGLARAGLLCHRAECEFNLGFQDRGLQAAAEAEKVIRTELDSPATACHATAYLPLVASAVQEGDHRERGIAILKEAMQRDETSGVPMRGRLLRYRLSNLIRREGGVAEANAILPPEEAVSERERPDYLQARGRARLAAGNPQQAADDFEACLQELARQYSSRDVLIAEAQCDLAEAYQAGGRAGDARALANTALEVLHCRERAGEADALLTLALLDWPAPEVYARALGIVALSKDLRLHQKAGAFDAIADRMQRAQLAGPAQRARDAAREQRAHLHSMAGYPDTECAVINS